MSGKFTGEGTIGPRVGLPFQGTSPACRRLNGMTLPPNVRVRLFNVFAYATAKRSYLEHPPIKKAPSKRGLSLALLSAGLPGSSCRTGAGIGAAAVILRRLGCTLSNTGCAAVCVRAKVMGLMDIPAEQVEPLWTWAAQL